MGGEAGVGAADDSDEALDEKLRDWRMRMWRINIHGRIYRCGC